MKKKVTNIEVIDYTAERGSHKGEKGQYVRLTLENRGNNWITSVNKNQEFLNITRPQNIVDVWLGFAKTISTENKKIEDVVPDDFRLIDRVFKVNVPLETKCFRVYRKDEVDKATGKVLHRKGEFYTTDAGEPAIYDSLEVLAVQYEDDDTGEMKWLQEPSSIVRDMLNRGYYKPVVVNTPAGEAEKVIEAEDVEVPSEAEKEPTIEELQAKLAALKAEQQGA